MSKKTYQPKPRTCSICWDNNLLNKELTFSYNTSAFKYFGYEHVCMACAPAIIEKYNAELAANKESQKLQKIQNAKLSKTTYQFRK